MLFEFPMPPSVNALYQRIRGGGLALTDAAKRYRERVKKIVTRQLPRLSRFPAQNMETIFLLDIDAFFNELQNPGWFQVISRGPNKGKKKAKSRYKKVDADNRIKFAQDALTKAMGINDDAQIFEVSIRKIQRREEPETLRVTIRVASPTRYGVEHGP
jgi:Holliday junction resolvase RusA-like endonuclease